MPALAWRPCPYCGVQFYSRRDVCLECRKALQEGMVEVWANLQEHTTGDPWGGLKPIRKTTREEVLAMEAARKKKAKRPDITREALEACIQQGMSMKQIMMHFGFRSPGSLYRYMHKYDLLGRLPGCKKQKKEQRRRARAEAPAEEPVHNTTTAPAVELEPGQPLDWHITPGPQPMSPKTAEAMAAMVEQVEKHFGPERSAAFPDLTLEERVALIKEGRIPPRNASLITIAQRERSPEKSTGDNVEPDDQNEPVTQTGWTRQELGRLIGVSGTVQLHDEYSPELAGDLLREVAHRLMELAADETKVRVNLRIEIPRLRERGCGG